MKRVPRIEHKTAARDPAPVTQTDETPETYPAFLADLKQRIRTARLQASLAINKEFQREA